MWSPHHHLLPAFIWTHLMAMRHPVNAACEEANEQYETNNDKKPGNKGKDFAKPVLLELCK